jgi:hypothetical protein
MIFSIILIICDEILIIDGKVISGSKILPQNSQKNPFAVSVINKLSTVPTRGSHASNYAKFRFCQL